MDFEKADFIERNYPVGSNGCQISTRIVRQPPIIKVTELQYLTFYSNKDFNLYLVLNAVGRTT